MRRSPAGKRRRRITAIRRIAGSPTRRMLRQSCPVPTAGRAPRLPPPCSRPRGSRRIQAAQVSIITTVLVVTDGAGVTGLTSLVSRGLSCSPGPLAHPEEQGTFNPKVPGSRPGRPTHKRPGQRRLLVTTSEWHCPQCYFWVERRRADAAACTGRSPNFAIDSGWVLTAKRTRTARGEGRRLCHPLPPAAIRNRGVDWASRIGPRHPLTSSRDRSSCASWLRDRTSSFVKTFRRW